jgi:hypothetical protein
LDEVILLVTQSEFTAIAEEEIDDDLTLLIARSEGIPRLGIFNTYSEKKKYVALSWIESGGKSLKIKVGRQTKEYGMDVIGEGVRSLIDKASEAIALNQLAWRGVHLLGDLIHVPKTARSEADLSIIAENKRDTLWFVYTPKKGKWRVRPCFMATGEEKKLVDASLTEAKPWPAILIENGELPSTMRNLPLAKELSHINPQRWSEFLLPVSKALLLGFSDWSSGGEHNFSEALWAHLPTQSYRSDETIETLAAAGKNFLSKITAYLRLWPVLENVKIERVPDVSKLGESRGLKKRERFEIVSASQGDKRFRVTRYIDEAGAVAFGIVPDTRLPGEGDRMITFTDDDWNASVEACSFGGEKDPQFTCISVLSGVEVIDWYARIQACLSGQPVDSSSVGEDSEDGDS